MAIKIQGRNLLNRYINGQRIGKIMAGRTEVRPNTGYGLESIVYKMKAGASGNLYAPTSYHPYQTVGGYNWDISVDGGTPVNYSGTPSVGGTITIGTGYTPDTEHLVVITPRVIDRGRAKPFCFYNVGIANLLTEVIQDSSYMGYTSGGQGIDQYFRAYQYVNCTSLRVAPAEYIPENTIFTYGSEFRYMQYSNCTSLTTPPAEVLPNISTLYGAVIGDEFRSYQYQGCTSLTSTAIEVLPNNITEIGYSFRGHQYLGCTSLTTVHPEVMPNTVTTIGGYFRYAQYALCSALVTPATESLSSAVTGVDDYFRGEQYSACTSLTTNATEIHPNSNATIGTYYRARQYYSNRALQTINLKAMSSGSSDFRDNQFMWSGTGTAIATIIGNVVDSAEYGAGIGYVSEIRVPSSLLSAYQNASNWSNQSSLFVGY